MDAVEVTGSEKSNMQQLRISIFWNCVQTESDQSFRQDGIRYFPDPYLCLLYGKETTEDMKAQTASLCS